MLDKLIYWLRWIIGAVVGAVLGVWLVAVLFALAGFRQTAEAISDTILGILPTAAILFGALVVLLASAAVIRWLRTPSSAG